MTDTAQKSQMMQGRENENKEKIKNCVGGTDDPSGYKNKHEQQTTEKSVLPILIPGRKNKQIKIKDDI